MNEQQTIERLAEFMGYDVIDTDHLQALYRGERRQITYFAPLKDWNHWRQVEEKVMESDWRGIFMEKFNRQLPEYLQADLPTRCRALVSVLPKV
jgi:hypothetical protein